jgi:hypothetical protein
MLGGKGKGGRVGQRESPSGTEVSPCLRVANLQKIFFFCLSRPPLVPFPSYGHAPAAPRTTPCACIAVGTRCRPFLASKHLTLCIHAHALPSHGRPRSPSLATHAPAPPRVRASVGTRCPPFVASKQLRKCPCSACQGRRPSPSPVWPQAASSAATCRRIQSRSHCRPQPPHTRRDPCGDAASRLPPPTGVRRRRPARAPGEWEGRVWVEGVGAGG